MRLNVFYLYFELWLFQSLVQEWTEDVQFSRWFIFCHLFWFLLSGLISFYSVWPSFSHVFSVFMLQSPMFYLVYFLFFFQSWNTVKGNIYEIFVFHFPLLFCILTHFYLKLTYFVFYLIISLCWQHWGAMLFGRAAAAASHELNGSSSGSGSDWFLRQTCGDAVAVINGYGWVSLDPAGILVL